MNILLLVVLIILIGSMLWGYWRGFIRIVFSIAAMAFTIALVSWINPYITDFIKQNTTIYEDMAEQYARRIQNSAREKIGQQFEETIPEGTKNNLEESLPGKIEESLQDKDFLFEIQLPEIWKQQLLEKTGETIDEFMEENDACKQVGEYVADKVLRGISFLISFVIISLLLKLLVTILDVIAKLPLIKGMNRLLGGIAGGIQGFFLVWIFLFLVTLLCTSPVGQTALAYINESVFLTFLYQYNPIMYLLCYAFG